MGNTRQATVDWPYAGPAGWRICPSPELAGSWVGVVIIGAIAYHK